MIIIILSKFMNLIHIFITFNIYLKLKYAAKIEFDLILGYLVAKLLYNLLCVSVCLLVRLYVLWGNCNFLGCCCRSTAEILKVLFTNEHPVRILLCPSVYRTCCRIQRYLATYNCYHPCPKVSRKIVYTII